MLQPVHKECFERPQKLGARGGLFRLVDDPARKKGRPYIPTLSVALSTETITKDNSTKCPADDAELTKGRAKSTLSPIHLVDIKGARKLASSMDDSIVHIEFDISQLLELKHNTGDHMAVWPEHKDAGTTALTTTLGLSEVDLTRCLGITANDPKGRWNSLSHPTHPYVHYIVLRAPGDLGKGERFHLRKWQAVLSNTEANITDNSVII
ncbi:unnamed protein product [Clonostachys rhizophaga]|uniref:Sulfite reductase [NADPH] flavoprotein alpha-component-like FAD-binding domain-containing protein n=1 Tax=Clonostachys rhizophaga TaxID=160324 RepID=A0A9N9YT97_9HYPO|nr:unnamed protein product [Clonostachys rhizophaga]